jgi:hypothetical protein
MAVPSEAVSFAWFDVALAVAIPLTAWALYRKQFRYLIGGISAAYLIFFWCWGLNYHRPSLATKLDIRIPQDSDGAVDEFRKAAAQEINRLYGDVARAPYDEVRIRARASERVAHIVRIIDGADWRATARLKTSLLANPWFGMAGIDGLFNPFGHEPIINSRLLEIERPFIMAHELAHVRAYPNEGDANLVAVLATLMSGDPHLEYSGWLHLWFYLQEPGTDALLDEGPRQDLQRIAERMRSQQVRWVSNLQAAVLDLYLKANSVPEGIRSYSQVLLLAIGIRGEWERFR